MVPTVELLGLTVGTHDLFSLTAIAVGVALYYRELHRRLMLDRTIILISLWVLVGGGIGARTLLAWEHLDYYGALASAPVTWAIEHSGKSLIGAVVGGYLAGVGAKWLFGYRRSTGDCYALAIPVAIAIGRVGCLLSELPLGTPTDLPWGVSVPAAVAARFPSCAGCDGPMHPSMAYEIAFSLLAIAAIVRWRAHIAVAGDLLKAYLVAAGVFRFFVEFVRTSPRGVLGLTDPQLVLIPLVGLLVLHFVREWRTGVLRAPAAPAYAGIW